MINITIMRNQQAATLPIYFQAIQRLRAAKDDTLDLIFHRLSLAWPSSIIEQEQFEECGQILEEKLHTFSQRFLAKTHYYLNRHRRELLRTYLLLRLHIQDEPLDAVTLPLAIKAILTSQFREYFEQPQHAAFLYLVCSMFMPMFIILMQNPSPEPLELVLSHPESICCSLSFAQMDSLYIQEGLFLRIMLERPLRILNDFPTLQGYDLYSRINLHDILEGCNCLVSSCLVSQKIITLVQTFNFCKIVHFSDVISARRVLNNNALLNTIEKLDVQHLFSQVPPSQQEGSELSTKSLCITIPISKRTFGKMHPFFECLPPQLAPLTKYDVLSYGSGEESNTLFFRLATEEYWEHCPQSEFLEVYYLANDSVVEWISLPHEEYTRSGKIRFWNENEIRAISSPRFQACRGVQRKGDFVMLGQGHEHSWRVSKGYGMAVLIKWSVLLKSKSQLTKFMDIIKEKQDNQLDTNWRLEIPHRRTFFSLLAHQHQVLDVVMRKRLVGFIMGKVAYEENTLIRLCRSFQDRLTLKKTSIPSKYRMCGICGREIMSICGRANMNIVCLDCLSDEIPTADCSVKFEVAYICKPSAFTNFFRGILSPPSEPTQALVNQAQRHAFYEQNFCQGKFAGCVSSRQPKHIEIHPQSHISNMYPSLQLHIFAKRNYFCTLESAFKCFCLKKSESQAERFQMRTLLGYLSCSFLNREQRQQIRECIYRHYHETNYVADGIRKLAEADPIP